MSQPPARHSESLIGLRIGSAIVGFMALFFVPSVRRAPSVREFIMGLGIGVAIVGTFFYQQQHTVLPMEYHAIDVAYTPQKDVAAPVTYAAVRTERPRGLKGIFKNYNVPETQLIVAVRDNEARYHDFVRKSARKHKVLRQYSREWMSYPDLRRLNNEWYRYHDPIRFAQGAARSKNLRQLLVKYSKNNEFRKFVREAVRQAPADLLFAIKTYTRSDPQAQWMHVRFAQATGVPLNQKSAPEITVARR
jgi:hypothetical protein